VQFIIRRDPEARYCFTSLQSPLGRRVLERYWPADRPVPDSVLLLEAGRLYAYSTAALKIAGHLRGWPRWLAPLGWLVPRFLRDAVYRTVARRRYRWFGRQEQCWLPTPELRARFATQAPA
jgi:predicted DCC family thiol-disulfide oxidoreductase YuxK